MNDDEGGTPPIWAVVLPVMSNYSSPIHIIAISNTRVVTQAALPWGPTQKPPSSQHAH